MEESELAGESEAVDEDEMEERVGERDEKESETEERKRDEEMKRKIARNGAGTSQARTSSIQPSSPQNKKSPEMNKPQRYDNHYLPQYPVKSTRFRVQNNGRTCHAHIVWSNYSFVGTRSVLGRTISLLSTFSLVGVSLPLVKESVSLVAFSFSRYRS